MFSGRRLDGIKRTKELGINVKIDHRSNRERGIKTPPEPKRGPGRYRKQVIDREIMRIREARKLENGIREVEKARKGIKRGRGMNPNLRKTFEDEEKEKDWGIEI